MQKRCTTVFVLALAGVVMTVGTASAQVPPGSITAVTGTVTLRRGGSATPARYGERIMVGDRITNESDGRVTVTLSDSSQFELIESSTLVLTEYRLNPGGSRASTKISLLEGMVHSLVRLTAGTPPNLEVRTPNAIATAHGTTYDTQYRKGATRAGYATCREFSDVSVYYGTVEVRNPNKPSAPPIELHAGSKTFVPCDLAAVTPAEFAGGVGSGLSAGGIEALGALGIAGIGGGIAAAIAAGGSSDTSSDPSSPGTQRTPASASQ